MAFAEDFSVFFDLDGFAVPFRYVPKAGKEINGNGIFDDAYFEAPGGEVGFSASQPRLTVESAIIKNPVYGETIVTNEKYYQIVGIQPDGTGVTTLILEETDATR